MTTQNQGGSGEMFDRIAARYDLLNRLISFGLDRRWRAKLVAALRCPERGRVLDVATGTGDVAIDIARAHPRATVTGLDPSSGMLEVGRRKVQEGGLAERVELVAGDAQQMQFDNNRFDASCIAFGIRNVPDRNKGLAEMMRATKPGGRVVVLELSEPRRGWMASLARLHVHHVVPRFGAWLSGEAEYRYLQRSIAAFPPPEQFAELMRGAGLTQVEVAPMTFGVAHLYFGTAN